jgi:hypothetical protein
VTVHCRGTERLHEHTAVVVVDDNHRLAIASRHHVIQRASELKTVTPRHARTIANDRPSAER